MLVESPTHTSSVGSISRLKVWKLTGWMHVTFAEDIAWTLFPLKLHKKTNSSSRELLEEISDTFGLQAENATLPDVIDQVIIQKLKIEKVLNVFSLDLQPPNENGWFWSGSGVKVGPTTQRNTGDWSYTGGYNQAQPDNREAAQVKPFTSFHYQRHQTFSFLFFSTGKRRILFVNPQQLL